MGTTPTSDPARESTTPSTTRSPQQSNAKRRHEQRKHDNRKALLASLKRFCVYVLAGTAIASSVLVIYSCKFFSYRDTAYYGNYGGDDYYRNNEIDRIQHDDHYIESLSYSPFEDLSDAGVGLFSYFVGDSSKIESFAAEDICFRYFDEATEYNLFRKSPAVDGGRTIDLWITARYCAIFAPIVAFLAFAQLLLEWFCGCRLAKCGSFVTTVLFLVSGVLQLGTFAVAFAPPNLLSDAPRHHQERFCFSAESTIQCRIDSGAWLSLASAILYFVLAFCSATLRTTRYSAARRDGDGEASSDTEYCGGCCIASKPMHKRRSKSPIKKKRRRKKEMGDTSSDSSFSSDDENDNRKKGQPKISSSGQDRLGAHGILNDLANANNSILNEDDNMEIGRNNNYADTFDYYDGHLAGTIEDDIRIQAAASTAIIDEDGDASIIKEVTSIETDFVHPGPGCCFCADAKPTPKVRRTEKRISPRKQIIRFSKSWHRKDVTSMLSDDDDDNDRAAVVDEEAGNAIQESTTNAYGVTGTTVEDCEALFMAELESNQCEHYNWQNSHWKKGFDFVRS